MYYVYMLRCADNSIYTGITTNVEHRMKEHFSKKNCAKYTYSHTAQKLECVWQTENRVLASKLEYRIKQLNKTKKEELIVKNNLEELLADKIEVNQYKKIMNSVVYKHPKKLIILTGISGTGKTTLAKYIQSKTDNVTIITVDVIFEQICEIIGFDNKKEKKRNRTIALNCFREILKECMKREDEIIIVDYPFRDTWQEFFNKISIKYDYEVLTIKLYGETFEEIYNRACVRDLSQERNVIHELSSYHPNEDKKLERNIQPEEILREIYESEARTNFIVGEELKLISKDEKMLQECFAKIQKWLFK